MFVGVSFKSHFKYLICFILFFVDLSQTEAKFLLKYEACGGYLSALSRYNSVPSIHYENTDDAVHTITRFRFNGLQAPDPWHAQANRNNFQVYSLDGASSKTRQAIAGRILAIENDFEKKSKNSAFFIGKTFRGREAIASILNEVNDQIIKVNQVNFLTLPVTLRRMVFNFLLLSQIAPTIISGGAIPVIDLPVSGPEVFPFLIGLFFTQNEGIIKLLLQLEFSHQNFIKKVAQSLNEEKASQKYWAYSTQSIRMTPAYIKSAREGSFSSISPYVQEVQNTWSVMDATFYYLNTRNLIWKHAQYVEMDRVLYFDSETHEPTLTVLFRIYNEKPKFDKPKKQSSKEHSTIFAGLMKPAGN